MGTPCGQSQRQTGIVPFCERKKQCRCSEDGKCRCTGQVEKRVGVDLNARLSGKIEEKSENVKRAASGCISVILKTAKLSTELIKLGAG